MITEKIARAKLFAGIEPGSTIIPREVVTYGAVEVLKRIEAGEYKNGEKILGIDGTAVLKSCEQIGVEFVTPESPYWPDSLSDLVSPPIALTAKGDLNLLKAKSLAIVGTRNPTNYGVRIAADFASGFVDRGWNIISGGAYGIDAAAHKGALIAEGATIAVLAAGLDIIYPAGHTKLFAEIAETGLLISEFAPGVHALPARFLTRNRLIAALGTATVVIEAAFRSGSLRTARDAAEMMRPVMAIPGPITSPLSEGCHRLIGERAAEIVTSVADAIEFIGEN
ncbi:MAG: hypothetical protein RL301_479 [Actinomycetota bacterium]|jgi:DNA protecting protein DprA